MSYTPIGWQTGDTITAEKMNKMDNGWGVATTSTQLFSETVTTEDQDGMIVGALNYATQITADSIIVTFDGTDYMVSKTEPFEDMTSYGTDSQSGPDFTTYPFYILSSEESNLIYTEAEGSYTVVASVPSTTVSISENFQKATIAGAIFNIILGTTTFQEVLDAMKAGKIVQRVYASSNGAEVSIALTVNLAASPLVVNCAVFNGQALAFTNLYADSTDGVLYV